MAFDGLKRAAQARPNAVQRIFYVGYRYRRAQLRNLHWGLIAAPTRRRNG